MSSPADAFVIRRGVVGAVLSLAVCLAAAPVVHGQSAENVAVVVNDNSADSQRIADHYARTRSRMPEPSAGRTISLNNHGTVVFLDRSEDAVLNGLGLFAAIGSACGGLLLVASRSKR